MDTHTAGYERDWGRRGRIARQAQTRVFTVVFGCVTATSISLTAPAAADTGLNAETEENTPAVTNQLRDFVGGVDHNSQSAAPPSGNAGREATQGNASPERLREQQAERQQRRTLRHSSEISARRADTLDRAESAAVALDPLPNHVPAATTGDARHGGEGVAPHNADIKPVNQPSEDAECVGGDVSQHPNGKIPESALCPLPQPGHMLRADAAAAFMHLDEAYEGHFGYPMCVTDAYRTLEDQERLFEELEPGMAAQPGTSEHGRGLAVDLCGGVNELGSPQHEWMLANAEEHGWHNPPWAQNGFEPWHWEYPG